MVDLCNDHAPVQQCRTARAPLQPQASDLHSRAAQDSQQPGGQPQQHQQQQRPDHSADMQRLLAFGQNQDSNPLRLVSV